MAADRWHAGAITAIRTSARHLLIRQGLVAVPTASEARYRFGGQGQNRTADTGIFSAVLYQLSYLAATGLLRMARSAPS